MNRIFILSCITILSLLHANTLGAQSARSTITFDNQAGEPATVKLVGPTMQVVEVPNGEKRTVHAAPGEYHLLARYGASPERYTYSKGEPFRVEETPTQYSVTTITLHKVIGGQYRTRPMSREEFERAAATGQTTASGSTAAPPDSASADPGLREALSKSASTLVIRDRQGKYWIFDTPSIGSVTGRSIVLRSEAKALIGELRVEGAPPKGLAEALAEIWTAVGKNPCDSPLGRVTHHEQPRGDGLIVYHCGDNKRVSSVNLLQAGRLIVSVHVPTSAPATIEFAELILHK